MARTIAFIGLGNMGGPMTANLVKAGHQVVGFDLSAACREAAKAGGASIAESARDALAEADIAITMLPAGQHVLAVWSEIVAAAKPGTLFIDCSTVDLGSARKAHAMAAEHAGAALDAPVSGGVAGAKAATLTFMAGGRSEAFAGAEPILASMGKRVVHCGEARDGQAG